MQELLKKPWKNGDSFVRNAGDVAQGKPFVGLRLVSHRVQCRNDEPCSKRRQQKQKEMLEFRRGRERQGPNLPLG